VVFLPLAWIHDGLEEAQRQGAKAAKGRQEEVFLGSEWSSGFSRFGFVRFFRLFAAEFFISSGNSWIFNWGSRLHAGSSLRG
jgi:hypothetical protein